MGLVVVFFHLLFKGFRYDFYRNIFQPPQLKRDVESGSNVIIPLAFD